MTQIYDKRYLSIGEATFGHIVFREVFIPPSDLTLNTQFVSNDLTANFQGASRQAFKILLMHDGGGAPTLDVEIQEFIPDPTLNDPFDVLTGGVGPHGRWATKGALGTGSASANVLFEHNQEDTMRWARIVFTPRTLLPDVGVRIVLSGRRYT